MAGLKCAVSGVLMNRAAEFEECMWKKMEAAKFEWDMDHGEYAANYVFPLKDWEILVSISEKKTFFAAYGDENNWFVKRDDLERMRGILKIADDLNYVSLSIAESLTDEEEYYVNAVYQISHQDKTVPSQEEFALHISHMYDLFVKDVEQFATHFEDDVFCFSYGG